MRDIVSISLPEWTAVELKQYSKERWFTSLSEYVLYLVEQDQTMITEEEVLQAWEEAKKEDAEGRTYEGLDSLKNHLWL